MTSRWGRLRLQRPTKPQDSFTLDLVYCAHGVPLATPTTTSNNGVEGAVQDKTLSQGVPSSKATSPTAEQKERRLFSIPLFESDLALHAHVLETGTTTASPVPPSHDDDVGAGAPIRRRRENCAQVALELRGIPTSAKTPSVTTPRRVAGSARGGADVDAPVLGTVGEEASPMIPNPASKDVVLAKRLRGGGELLLPCSCIWPSKGSCTILVRFPSPAFAEATRLESIEVLIAGLCSIMPPVVGIPSMPTSPQRGRLYAAAFAPPTPAPGTISTGTSNASSNAGLRERQIGARPCVAAPYAHIPYVLLGPSPSDPSTVSYMRRSISASPEAPYAESEECTESNSSVARATVSRQSSGLQGGGSISSCDQSVLGSTAGTGAFHRGASLHVTFYFPGSLQQPPRAPSASEGGVRTEMEEHPLHGSPLPLDPSDASSHSGGPRGSTVSSAGRSTAQYAPPPQPPSSQPSSRWATEDRPCCIPEDAGTLRSIHTATQILQQLQSVTIGCPAPATTTTGRRHGSERGRAVDEELAIQAVSRRLQQLQGFRRNVRALVKQQIYDAEDIQGEVTNTSAMNEVHRGEHLRSIQREARTAVGLALPVPGGEASTLSRRDASTSFYSPEVSCAALPCPLAGLTVAQGRSICGSAVPWTIWQWAHRWPLISSCYRNWGLPSVSLSPSPPGLHASSAPPWRGVDGSPLATPNLSGIPRSPPWSAAPGQMDDSDSSEEAYGLGHGSWMDETLAANHASPKTVWLPEIQFAPTPLFLRPPGGT